MLLNLCALPVHAQDVPVDLYTGRPFISIPLYTVNDRSLSYSFGLGYDATGVKVDSKPGHVGLNWNLTAGGEVRREVRGLPDDHYTTSGQRGWLYASNSNPVKNAELIGNYVYPADGSTLSCSSEPAHYNFINAFNSLVDSEPDLYHFSAGGLTGTFVFDNTGNIINIKTVPYQEIKITASLPGTSGITSFEIVDDHGIKYIFTIKETTVRDSETSGDPFFFRKDHLLYANSITYASAWKLDRMESPMGEFVQFGYASKVITSGSVSRVNVATGSTANPSMIDQYATVETITTQRLTTITTPHQSVSFEYEELNPAQAFTADDLILKRIVVNEITPASSLFVMDWNFVYKNVGSSLEASGGFVRKFLKELYSSNDCETRLPYRFTYHGVFLEDAISQVALPSPGSIHQDIWGYYKNNSSGYAVPQLYVYPNATGIQKISLFQRAGVTPEIIIPGADRNTTTAPVTGSLVTLQEPGGAKWSFSYESNEFLNPVTSTVMNGMGLRIASVVAYDGVSHVNDITTSYEYKKEDNTSSGVVFSMPVFWGIAGCQRDPNTGAITSWSSISGMPASEQWTRLLYRTAHNINPDFNNTNPYGYSRVTVRQGTARGKVVHTFTVPNVYGGAPLSDWSPTYTHVARSSSCPAAGLQTPGFYNSLPTYQTPYDDARGLLLSTAWYAENESAPLREILNTYSSKTISSGIVKGLSYDFVMLNASSYYFMYGAYVLNTGKVPVLTATVERTRDRSNPLAYLETQTTFTYGGTNHPFVTQASVTGSDGAVSTTRSKYVKDYPYSAIASTDQQVKLIDALYTQGRVSDVVEQVHFITPPGGTEMATGGALNLYADFGNAYYSRVAPQQSLRLEAGSGIPSFNLSSYSGTGASRTFQRNAAYRVVTTGQFSLRGDLIRSENSQRQYQGYHYDNLTGNRVASFSEASPDEVVFSSFDHDTDYDFDLINFTTTDKNALGRTGVLGLAGWTAGSGKYLKKTFTRKIQSRYLFRCWYQSPVADGNHSLTVSVKDLSNTVLAQSVVNIPVSAANTWYPVEALLDLSALTNTQVVLEVTFSGTFTSASTAVLDDVIFTPEGSEFTHSTFHPVYGTTAATNAENQITRFEYNGAGQLRYVRDHNDNIIRKNTYTRWSAEAINESPLRITVPEIIYDNTATTLTAYTACLEIASLKWKIAPASDTTQGVFFNGSEMESYTFTSVGSYVVKLKVSHPTYGSYETFITVSVLLKPLAVSVCATGATQIELCQQKGEIFEACVGVPKSKPIATTTFVAVISGCPTGETYTVTWQRRPRQSQTIPWSTIGTGSTNIVVQNDTSYDIRAVVTSSCGRSGISNIKSVYIYHMSADCSVPQN
jgi:YD repeat-containing protein